MTAPTLVRPAGYGTVRAGRASFLVHRRSALVAVGLLLLLAASSVAYLCVGERFVGPSEVLRVLLGQPSPSAFVVAELREPRQRGQGVRGSGQQGGAGRQEVRDLGEVDDLVGIDGTQPMTAGADGGGGAVSGLGHEVSALSREETNGQESYVVRVGRRPGSDRSDRGVRGPTRSSRGNTPGRSRGAAGKARTARGRDDPSRCRSE